MNRPTLIPPAAVVVAALLFAAGLIGAALIIRDGLKLASQSLAASIDKHADVMSRSLPDAGEAAGKPISEAVDQMSKRLQRPVLKIESPLDLKQPVRIEGPREDGSLPVNATVGK